MGITNLLPFLEASTRQCHISTFRGASVAVDSYCWLHKGAIGCAGQLAKGEKTDLFVSYCVKYVRMLLSYDIKPIMVFDGRPLPAKEKTEIKRRESKSIAKKQAINLLRLGKLDESKKLFQQCVDITAEMALEFMKECRKLNVDCIVAPYEADAQLAFFSTKGIAECVITEDSDLLLFGCKKALYKMDINGHGLLVDADKINLSMKMKPEVYTFDKFRYMCILSGCDYVDSLRGVGLKKALKFLTMTAETNPELFLEKVPRYLNLRKAVVDDEYKENFLIADATFRYQIVFDPFSRKLVPLNEFDESTKIEYCRNAGELFDNNLAFQLAIGNLDPLTMKKIDDWEIPDINQNYSIWSKNFKPAISRKLEKENKINLCKPTNKNYEKKYNVEYDVQIEKELEFYKTPIKNNNENSEISSETESDLETSTSPVLGHNPKNPFIKQKISKFTSPNVDNSKCVVKSRFFCSESENSEIITDLHSTKDLFVEENSIKVEVEETSVLLEINCDISDDVNNSQIPKQLSPSLIVREKDVFPKSGLKKRKAKTVPSTRQTKTIKNQITIDKFFTKIPKN